jgi:hypothetical protein
MFKYKTHAMHGRDGKLEIRLIENGFLVSYKVYTNIEEKYFRDKKELFEFLEDFYQEKKS